MHNRRQSSRSANSPSSFSSSSSLSALSKGTPGPILGHAPNRLLGGVATGETALRDKAAGGSLLPRTTATTLLSHRPPRGGSRIAACVIVIVIVIVIIVIIITINAMLAPANAASGIPLLIVAVAGIAGAGGEAVRVEAGVLVEGDGEGGVVGAEDVAAVAAVVAAFEDVEGGAALG